MTREQVYLYLNTLLYDKHTSLLSGRIIAHSEKYHKNRPKKYKGPNIESHRNEYTKIGLFKRLLLRIIRILRDTHGEKYISQIPKHIRMEIVRCLLPDIIAYYESEQGQRDFAEWKAQQNSEQ